MKASAYEVTASSSNSVAAKIAKKIGSGLSFDQILKASGVSEANEALIYEYKARISELLRDGVPFATVINNVFKDPAIKAEIMAAYQKNKGAK